MPRYTYTLGGGLVRESHVLQSSSFEEALDAIAEDNAVADGDTLEIGVPGFPPAQFEYLWSADLGAGVWWPARKRRAA